MKYVIFKKKMEGITIYHPVIFPNNMVHVDVADDLTKGSLKGYTVYSAGEIASFDLKVKCSGFSTTLLTGPKKDDNDIITMNDYGSGIK